MIVLICVPPLPAVIGILHSDLCHNHNHPPQALKRKDERYTLIWPEKSEFVRMAARFGATIVPFGAVGAEDAFNQVGHAWVFP